MMSHEGARCKLEPANRRFGAVGAFAASERASAAPSLWATHSGASLGRWPLQLWYEPLRTTLHTPLRHARRSPCGPVRRRPNLSLDAPPRSFLVAALPLAARLLGLWIPIAHRILRRGARLLEGAGRGRSLFAEAPLAILIASLQITLSSFLLALLQPFEPIVRSDFVSALRNQSLPWFLLDLLVYALLVATGYSLAAAHRNRSQELRETRLEIEFLKRYVDLQKARYDDRLDVRYEVDEGLFWPPRRRTAGRSCATSRSARRAGSRPASERSVSSCVHLASTAFSAPG